MIELTSDQIRKALDSPVEFIYDTYTPEMVEAIQPVISAAEAYVRWLDGRERIWLCRIPELRAYECGEDTTGAHPAWLRKHAQCGWIWAVSAEEDE